MPSPPVVENARSVVLLLAGPTPVIWAVPLESGRPNAPIEIPSVVAPASIQLRAFFYLQSLESLKLPYGEVRGEAKRTCDLLRPLRAMSVAERGVDWTEQSLDLDDESRSALLPLGCEIPDRCQRFEVTEFELPVRNDVVILQTVAPDRVLVGAKNGQFSWLTKEGLSNAPIFQDAPDRTLYEDPDGTFWLGGSKGRLEQWSLQGRLGIVPVATSTTETILGIGGLGDERIVVSAIDDDHVRIYYRQSDSWQTIYEQPVIDQSSSQTKIHFLEPNRALISYGGAMLLLFENGAVEPIVIESRIPLLELKVNGIASIKGRGTYLCANDGALYEAINDRYRNWASVRGAGLGDGIESLIAVEDGLVFGGANGLFNQFYPGSQICISEPLVRSDVEEITEVEDGFVVSGGNPDRGRPNSVGWLTVSN